MEENSSTFYTLPRPQILRSFSQYGPAGNVQVPSVASTNLRIFYYKLWLFPEARFSVERNQVPPSVSQPRRKTGEELWCVADSRDKSAPSMDLQSEQERLRPASGHPLMMSYVKFCGCLNSLLAHYVAWLFLQDPVLLNAPRVTSTQEHACLFPFKIW